MDKRYQIFISSTFVDLKEERKAIIENLLNANYIPAGMEMFSASNDEQFKYIKKIIDTCDYYILIVGARYGTINPVTGISFTEQEYDYAIYKNIPVLAFLHDDPYNLPAEKREDDKKELLEKFRNKVSKTRLCKMWNNLNELVTSVIISLTQETYENPQLGWTRGSIYDTTELLVQINELRLEKEKLEQKTLELKKVINTNTVKIENLACGEDTYLVKGEKWSSEYERYIVHEIKLTWDSIFSAIAPHLIASKSYYEFKEDLKKAINTSFNEDFFKLNDDCVQTIKIQFNVLGLMHVRVGKSTKGNIAEFIGLTTKGKEYLLQIKAIKKDVEKF